MNKNFLGSWSIDGKELPMVVTIKSYTQSHIVSERGEEDKLSLFFEEKLEKTEKPMIINDVNGEFATELFGTANVIKWVGKKIGLTINRSVRVGRDTVEALRFCDLPKAKIKETLTLKHPKWNAAKKSVQDGTTITQIRKHYTITQKNFNLLCKPD